MKLKIKLFGVILLTGVSLVASNPRFANYSDDVVKGEPVNNENIGLLIKVVSTNNCNDNKGAVITSHNKHKPLEYKKNDDYYICAKANKKAYLVTLASMKDVNGKQFHYLLENSHQELETTISNKWQVINGYDVVPPFGNEIIQLFAFSKSVKSEIEKKYNLKSKRISIKDNKTELYDYVFIDDITGEHFLNTNIILPGIRGSKPKNGLNAKPDEVWFLYNTSK